jgi:hypothetical protein
MLLSTMMVLLQVITPFKFAPNESIPKMGSETMEEPFDKDLELVKLQIAANDCLADLQINMPTYLSAMVVFFVFGFSVMLQYPASVPAASMFALMAVGLVALSGVFIFLARRNYQDGVRALNGYEKDFRAGKPLPPFTTLCGVKEKKRIPSSCECKASTK